jgi:hypothetical protein
MEIPYLFDDLIIKKNNSLANSGTREATRLVASQVLHFFGLKPCKNAFYKEVCNMRLLPKTEVLEQRIKYKFS